MLPAFIIGLREGLEAVVIVGAIAVFLRAKGRGDLLRRIWRASAVAAAICIVVGFIVRFVEVNLAWRQQEQFETVVGFAAVCMVTYMVVWMRRFPKDLQRDSSAAAASALSRDSQRALVLLAFFAVLREGFEIAVFVVATIGMTGSNAWLATIGAVLGVVIALVAGVAVVRGSAHIDMTRFFRVTALVLVLSAAGIAMATVHSANAAGWITFGQTPQFDISWLAPPGTVLSSITTGMFGIQPYPVIVEVVTWFAYFIPMAAVVLWPKRRTASQPPISTEGLPGAIVLTSRNQRPRFIGVVALCVALAALGIGLAISGGKSPLTGTGKTTTPRILYATLDAVACPSKNDCFAVGDFLPADKDAAIGDPDGDGRAPHTLAESTDGSGWHLLSSPDKGKGGAVLSGISCPTVAYCVAVGYYRRAKFPLKVLTAPPNYPLIESYNGRVWRTVPSPNVAPNSVLVGISCPDTTFCIAVGYTTTSTRSESSLESLFVETFNGKSWSVMPTSPLPSTSSGLTSVSCPSDSECIAVGNVASRSNPSVTHPLVEALEQGHWSQASLPAPSEGPGILYDVDCTSVGKCIAVGTSEASRPSGAALVLSLTGPTWSINSAALSQNGDVSLTSVACANDLDCVAAGTSWLSLSASPKRILARIGKTDWHELGLLTTSTNIDAVACPMPARCLLVGDAPQNIFGNTTALVAALSGGSWVKESSPVP